MQYATCLLPSTPIVCVNDSIDIMVCTAPPILVWIGDIFDKSMIRMCPLGMSRFTKCNNLKLYIFFLYALRQGRNTTIINDLVLLMK